MNNVVIDFFVELLTRLFSKSPKFFVVIQWISGVVGFVTGGFMLLDWLKIPIPASMDVFTSKTMLICAFISLVIAKLPKADAPTKEEVRPY